MCEISNSWVQRFLSWYFPDKPYCRYIRPTRGVQRRMISVDNVFVFLSLLFFALLLLYET